MYYTQQLTMQIATVISNNINDAVQHLLHNNVVAIPTETVYGLAANALNPQAVIKIFEAKNRPTFNPLIVHCHNWQDAAKYVTHIPKKLQPLIENFSPGPITFLLPKNNLIPDIVTAGSNLVAIRVPNHPITLQLLSLLPFPLAAPSANEFGYISPTTENHVMQSLGGKIPFILSGNSSIVGLESTIVSINEQNKVVLHRHGGITQEQIEALINEPIVLATNPETNITSGQLKSHYAPNAPLYIGNIENLLLTHNQGNVCTLSLHTKVINVPNNQQYFLSINGDLKQAAYNLFNILRQIDNAKPTVILAQLLPNIGLGVAINDRLQRASAANKNLA